MSAKYLKKDRRGWYVRVRVPRDIQAVIGKTEIKRTLQTRDEKEALRKRHSVLGEIFALFDEARNPKASDSIDNIKDMVKKLQCGADPYQGLEPLEIFDIARDSFIKSKYGDPEDPDVRDSITQQDLDSLRALNEVVQNSDAHLLEDVVDIYLNEKKSTITNQTFNTKSRRLSDFIRWIGKHTLLVSVSKRKAGEYVTSHLMSLNDRYGRPLSAKTKKDTISDLRAFFNWCEGRGYIESNPFANITRTIGEVIKGAPKNRRSWNRSELSKLLQDNHLREDKAMMGLILIALYTGMRGNEIAELKLEDVAEDYLRVTDGKNNNSIRKVPIHKKLAPVIEHLKSTSKDGYLLDGLSRGGEDNKRYHNIGKKFNRRRKKLGFSNDTVFHSFRNTLATALENAGVPHDVAEMVAGHSDQNRGLTYSLYSDGLEHDVLAETLNKASYGEEVDAIVDEIVSEVFSS